MHAVRSTSAATLALAWALASPALAQAPLGDYGDIPVSDNPGVEAYPGVTSRFATRYDHTTTVFNPNRNHGLWVDSGDLAWLGQLPPQLTVDTEMNPGAPDNDSYPLFQIEAIGPNPLASVTLPITTSSFYDPEMTMYLNVFIDQNRDGQFKDGWFVNTPLVSWNAERIVADLELQLVADELNIVTVSGFRIESPEENHWAKIVLTSKKLRDYIGIDPNWHDTTWNGHNPDFEFVWGEIEDFLVKGLNDAGSGPESRIEVKTGGPSTLPSLPTKDVTIPTLSPNQPGGVTGYDPPPPPPFVNPPIQSWPVVEFRRMGAGSPANCEVEVIVYGWKHISGAFGPPKLTQKPGFGNCPGLVKKGVDMCELGEPVSSSAGSLQLQACATSPAGGSTVPAPIAPFEVTYAPPFKGRVYTGRVRFRYGGSSGVSYEVLGPAGPLFGVAVAAPAEGEGMEREFPFEAPFDIDTPATFGIGTNDTPLHNGSDEIWLFSEPSSGFSAGAAVPDRHGDLFWRAHPGNAMMNDVDSFLGAAMEIDGYHEELYDTDWSTPPSFYVRMHGHAVQGTQGLAPEFFDAGFTTEIAVVLGNSGLGSPCTVVPSLCSPSGGSCPPTGYVNGYTVDVSLGSTVGSGVVVPADGTMSSDLATTYFVHGGMIASGGMCGLGDYDLQGCMSTDESAGDPSGLGFNPDGGYQMSGSGPIQQTIGTTAVATETWRGNVLNVIADSGTGLGVEPSTNGGGAQNGRYLRTGTGFATIGVEIRDLAGASFPNLGIAGLSFTPLPNPGLPVLGGNFLVLPDGVFNATSSVWQGPVLPASFGASSEGVFQSEQLPFPAVATGFDVYLQGATLSLITLLLDTTNAVRVSVLP